MSNLIHIDFARKVRIDAAVIMVKPITQVDTLSADEMLRRPKAAPAKSAFKVGETYYGSHVCDSESVFEFTVIKVNPKSVTIENTRGLRKTVKVFDGGTYEYVFPYGRYSMAAILSADRKR